MIKCKNCGAFIDEKLTHCPFCNAMQYDASENEYMDKLNNINSEMDNLDDKAEINAKNRVKLAIEVVIAGIAVALCLAAITGYFMAHQYDSSKHDIEELHEQMNWYDENIDQINQFYVEKNYNGIYNIIKNTDYSKSELLTKWKHYYFVNIYTYNYYYIEKYIKNEEVLDDDNFVYIYQDCLNYISEINGYSYKKVTDKNDLEQIDIWTQNVYDYVENTLKISKDDFLNDYNLTYGSGNYPSSNELKEIIKKYR